MPPSSRAASNYPWDRPLARRSDHSTMSGKLERSIQGTLTLESFGASQSETGKRRGPPNRMNDLVYRDWMKFQKSFFRYTSDQALIEECIYFFTKAVWDDGSPSRTLVVGCDTFCQSRVPAPRVVSHVHRQSSFAKVSDIIRSKTEDFGVNDFVLVDLRTLIKAQPEHDNFINCHAEDVFDSLRGALAPQRYCCILVGLSESNGGGFPFPWAIGLAGRSHLRLRDEKVGLLESEGRVFYCLFMQAEADGRPRELVTSRTFRLSDRPVHNRISAWVIPKPPPRKPNELLHPAKFPETLVEELIKTHSSEMDNVFDPMVGTGSTVLAALRTNRYGYGTDLSEEFISIAQERIDREMEPSLFGDPISAGRVFVADATKLGEIRGLDGIQFQYAVTSPPYWSMLRNPGNENQEARRRRNLPLVYSDNPRDLGNIANYDQFLDVLEKVYSAVAEKLSDNGVLTVVIKNVKRNHILHTLAWDLACRLCGPKGSFDYAGTTLWCQDDVSIKPFAVGIYWVSNILHTYCVHFQKRELA